MTSSSALAACAPGAIDEVPSSSASRKGLIVMDPPDSRACLAGSAHELPQADEIAGRVAHPRHADVALQGRRRHHLAGGGCCARRRVDLLDAEIADEAFLALRWAER